MRQPPTTVAMVMVMVMVVMVATVAMAEGMGGQSGNVPRHLVVSRVVPEVGGMEGGVLLDVELGTRCGGVARMGSAPHPLTKGRQQTDSAASCSSLIEGFVGSIHRNRTPPHPLYPNSDTQLIYGIGFITRDLS